MALPIISPQNDFPKVLLGRKCRGNETQDRRTSALNSAAATPQITTINVTAAANSTTYGVRVAQAKLGISELVEVATDSSATPAELTALILAGILANPIIGAAATATSPTSTTVRLTATNGGTDFAFTVTFPTNPATALTQTATQAAANLTSYYMGRACERVGILPGNWTVRHVQPLTGPTATYTVTYAGGATYSGTISLVDGFGVVQADIPWTAAAGGNLAAALANIDTALTAALPSTFTVDSTGSPDVVITAPPGWTIVQASAAATAGAMTSAIVAGDTVPTYFYVRDPMDSAPIRGQTDSEILIQPGTAVPIVEGGAGWWGADAPGTVTAGARVYVETAAGDDQGKFTDTESQTTAPFIGGQWIFTDAVDTTVAALQLPV